MGAHTFQYPLGGIFLKVPVHPPRIGVWGGTNTTATSAIILTVKNAMKNQGELKILNDASDSTYFSHVLVLSFQYRI